VGILFFLFEFFSDQLLAFMVLSVVWLSEIFSVISLRTVPSISFFPRAFFFYFSLFHIYFFSFPFGFSYLALFTTVLYIQHSMVFCWNTYEIPALESGLITALTLRVGMGQQVPDLRTSDGTAVAPTALSEIQRIAGQSSGSSEGHSLQSIQVASPSNLLTAEIPPDSINGPYSVSSTGTAQRRRSSTETDFEHEEHLRESYSRHVELSRRIQQEQLSAMLGIHVPNSSGMSQSSHSNSLPPSPYRSRAGSIFNSTPLSSPRPHEEHRHGHGHGHGLRSNSSDSMQGRGDTSLLSYPISFIASLSMGFSWLGMSSGSDASRDYREMDSQSGYEGEGDESTRRLHRVSSVDGDTSEEVRGNGGCDEDDSPGAFRSTRAGIISPCATPSRRQISRSGSGKSKESRNARKGVITPVRSPFSNMLSGSQDLGSSFDLTDTDTSNAVRRSAYSPVRSSRGSGDSRLGIPGVLDVDDIEPQRVSRSGGNRGRESKNQGQSSGRSEPSKYQHNELMMYNSDIDVTDELLNFGAARVGGVPPTQSLLSFARPVDQSVMGIDGVENIGYWNSRSIAGESTLDDYFLRDRFTSNPVGRESSSSGGSSDPNHSSSSSPDKAAALDSSSSSSSSTGIARNDAGSAHYSKSRPSPLRLPMSYSPERVRERERERESKRESPQRLHEIDKNTGYISPVKQDGSSAVVVSEPSGKHPNRAKGSKKASRSLRPSRTQGSSSSLSGTSSSSSDGLESASRSLLPLHPRPAHGQNQAYIEPVPTTPTLTGETLVLSPARRVPSVNDFGYRRNDFNMFGNDFNEDD
jgi:hypothetical protein